MHEDRKSKELYGPVFHIHHVIGSFIAPAHTFLNDWMDDYRQDHEVFTYFFNPATRELKDDKRQHFKYGRLWADDKIVVPKNRIHHDPIVAGHWWVHRTLSMIQRRFYFPRMRKLVSDHISSCDVCQHAKADHHRPRGLMERVSLRVQKWQAIVMDWIVGLPRITRDGRGYESVLTVTDRATKMTHFIPTWKEATAIDTADQFIKHIVKYHGLPRSIMSDRDT